MSLAFLSKKSWHTANLRNVEKVWIAEQKHAAEEKKVAELRKNIEEERQLQELRQLQADQGNKSAAVERVDWMYEGPSAGREKTAEEFLLGKEYKGEDGKVATGDIDLSTTTKYGSLALTKSTLPANDAFQRLNEDPMMLIRKRQQATREEVLKNPVKMKRIKDQVDRLKEEKKMRKKAKKEAKKERKQARRDEKHRLKKSKKSDDDSNVNVNEKEVTEHCREDCHDGHPRGYGRDRESGKLRLRSRSISPVFAYGDDNLHRSHACHREGESERRERSSVHHRSDRLNLSQHADERRRERSSSRDQRSSKVASRRRCRSRSRSPRRHKQRGRSRNRSSQYGRDAFGRDRPSPRPVDRFKDRRGRTLPREERKRDTGRRNEGHRDISRPRSPVDHAERHRSRSPVERKETRRSHSPSDRQDRFRSRSSGKRYKKQRDSTTSKLDSARRVRSVRQRSGSSEQEEDSSEQEEDIVKVQGREQLHKKVESRRKPVDIEGKYGLISKAGAVESKDVDKTSLGPNNKYLAKAREAKRLEEKERHRKLGKSFQTESRVLTDEEKRKMAQQMVEDAKQREEYIVKRAALKKDELDKREHEATSGNPEFLRKLHSEAYLNDESNMSDRLRRNAHYIQRKADASNFLSK
ncbi:unnamed protein product [Peronospora belbahrii]|uniref:CBF1-interacting co-repressor CIR N-terminal domain-containing protein n=1 Tax=Peronospora belbahrii TaxID=622444 RepID=A0ABN8CZB7_9STRA|nr:unnamed protein product [Peronospora belbahrii]